MLTRRELVTGSAMATVAAAAEATVGAAPGAGPLETPLPQAGGRRVAASTDDALKRIADKTTEIDETLDGLGSAFRTNSLAYGFVPRLRATYTLYWKSHAKFPEFCEIGTAVFYDLYDWHIKHRQPIPVSRLADGRMSITFMYTQLLVRVDQSPDYIGIPFDRQ